MNTPGPVALRDRPTILLIEDEPTRCGLLTEALQEEGFAVAHADDVPDALRQARACEPDLIVIDPRPTASVARELNRLRSDPATTGLPLIVIRRTGMRIDSGGVYAWPAGPVDVDLLLEHVWRVVNRRVLGVLNGHGPKESTLCPTSTPQS
jgi:CheY-like chemotaxis protein